MNTRSSATRPQRAPTAPRRGLSASVPASVPSSARETGRMKAPHLIVAQGRIDTPMGTMTAAVTDHGLAGLWFDRQTHHPGAIDARRDDQHPHVQAARRWLDAYWRGDATPNLALDAAGTPFQRAVWHALLAIPCGETSTYGAIASAVGRPSASRAVGAAVGRNPIGIVVPCHRVIGRDGTLTGYAGGLDRKEQLLTHEHAATSQARRPSPQAGGRSAQAELDLPATQPGRA